MNYIKNNLGNYKYNLLAVAIFMVMVALGGCSKNDTGTSPYGGGSSTGTGYGNTGGGNTGGGNTSTSQVMMQGMAFSPASLTVSAGTTVTWLNKDPYAHTVTSGTPGSPDGKFDSGIINGNGSYSYTFATKGTYNYYCKIHAPNMVGTITVQ